MTGYRNVPPGQRPTTPRPSQAEAAYRDATVRQQETRARLEQTPWGRRFVEAVERIGRGG